MNICGNEIADGLAREDSYKDSTHGGALFFLKLLHKSNKMSVPLGSKPPYMSDMRETILVLLCLGKAVGKMNILSLGIAVDILELNGIWWVLKFTLLV
ncbi:uncharacterized protein TNCV_3766281 [Trichonephila clavipes]|nr:uncharacterized protein TNCV_3766281 [Trichonephila clavipes]